MGDRSEKNITDKRPPMSKGKLPYGNSKTNPAAVKLHEKGMARWAKVYKALAK